MIAAPQRHRRCGVGDRAAVGLEQQVAAMAAVAGVLSNISLTNILNHG
jgi:hypothetical protein